MLNEATAAQGHRGECSYFYTGDIMAAKWRSRSGMTPAILSMESFMRLVTAESARSACAPRRFAIAFLSRDFAPVSAYRMRSQIFIDSQ
jgi:hypothetical protein